MMMLEKLEACSACGEVKRWLYDSQLCCACGYGDPQRGHSCDAATQEFRLQNDREWREKLDHLKGENARLRAILDFQDEPVEGPLDGIYSQHRDRIDQLERLALKAFTVVEWVVGEGKLLSEPHYDADDLLLEMAQVLGVEDSRAARAKLGHVLDRRKTAGRT